MGRGTSRNGPQLLYADPSPHRSHAGYDPKGTGRTAVATRRDTLGPVERQQRHLQAVGARQRARSGRAGAAAGFHVVLEQDSLSPLPPSLLPAILVSGRLSQPLPLPGKALRPPCPPDSQVSPSTWCPAKPSPTHSLRSGFDCIAYPLWSPRSGDLEPRAALESAGDQLFHMGDLETALASDTSRGQRDVPSGLPGEWSYPTWWW